MPEQPDLTITDLEDKAAGLTEIIEEAQRIQKAIRERLDYLKRHGNPDLPTGKIRLVR